MATAKKASTAKVEKATKASAEKPAKVAKAAAEKAEPTEKKAKVAGAQSAAALFKELIMAGKLTDDKIFEKVQEKFGLDDSKRSYVAWYRKDLIKKGVEGVPEAKGGK